MAEVEDLFADDVAIAETPDDVAKEMLEAPSKPNDLSPPMVISAFPKFSPKEMLIDVAVASGKTNDGAAHNNIASVVVFSIDKNKHLSKKSSYVDFH